MHIYDNEEKHQETILQNVSAGYESRCVCDPVAYAETDERCRRDPASSGGGQEKGIKEGACCYRSDADRAGTS